VRRDEHPLIPFRDDPTGRRAGLIGGPDVWEVVNVPRFRAMRAMGAAGFEPATSRV